MSSIVKLLTAATICLLVAATVHSAAVPQLITYQGRLTSSTGTPFTGNKLMKFVLYNSANSAIWNSGFITIACADGLFSVNLGASGQPALPSTIFADTGITLGITVDVDPEMSPRTRLTSQAFAYRALTADTSEVTKSVADNSITGAKIVNGTISFVDVGQNGAVLNQVMKWNGSTWVAAIDETGGGGGSYLPLAGGIMTGPITNTGFPAITMGKGNFGSGNTNSGDNAFVAGASNTVGGDHSTIVGGRMNSTLDTAATVCGGAYNQAGGKYSFVAGQYDTIPEWVFNSTISGGARNYCGGDYNTISGGYRNVAGASWAVVAGGTNNNADGLASFVAGYSNYAGGYASVAGGIRNVASGYASCIGGGETDTAAGYYATVAGGLDNVALDSAAAVCGGNGNRATGMYSFVGGGGGIPLSTANNASGRNSTVTGGSSNYASGNWSAVGGGAENTASGDYACVVGGRGNTAEAEGSLAAGGLYNIASGLYSTVGGGALNRARGSYSVVGGGGSDSDSNSAQGAYSAILGGHGHVASGSESTVGGGYRNYARGDYSVVGGGGGWNPQDTNLAGGTQSVVAGGTANIASGQRSTVGGGILNVASGYSSTTPGGSANHATGDYSFAAGYAAYASHEGAMVLNDHAGGVLSSTAANEFSVRAAGGTRIFSDADNTAGVTLAAGASAWASVSDSAAKRNIRPVDGNELLKKIEQLPVSRWSYKSQDPSIEHIGPMAQDFYALFGVGESDTTISTIDPSGIALAAVKELARKNADLQIKVDELNRTVQVLLERLNTISDVRDNSTNQLSAK